jgi:putative transposase
MDPAELREAIPSDHSYCWLAHDRSGIFSEDLDCSIEALGIEVLKTPVRAPKANACCERLIGSLRRECLDWFVPLNERHLRMLVREWATHYNHGRPHKSLGPGIPAPPPGLPVRRQIQRHKIPKRFLIKKKAILGGLHHEYRLEKIAA